MSGCYAEVHVWASHPERAAYNVKCVTSEKDFAQIGVAVVS